MGGIAHFASRIEGNAATVFEADGQRLGRLVYCLAHFDFHGRDELLIVERFRLVTQPGYPPKPRQ
ncbi:hypothetical protein D3C87_1968830 [compost metagenome]